jgi:hypothetical protein
LPKAKLKDRQMTCGDMECQRQWHRKKCGEWNRKNVDYFRTNYLHKKMAAATGSGEAPKPSEPVGKRKGQVRSRLRSGLPLAYVQEVIGIQDLVIIEYLAQQLVLRFQEVIKAQVPVNTEQMRRLPGRDSSRGDGL